MPQLQYEIAHRKSTMDESIEIFTDSSTGSFFKYFLFTIFSVEFDNKIRNPFNAIEDYVARSNLTIVQELKIIKLIPESIPIKDNLNLEEAFRYCDVNGLRLPNCKSLNFND